MPWDAKDAFGHTHKADTAAKKKKWAKVASAILAKSGNEASAIRIANSMMGSKK